MVFCNQKWLNTDVLPYSSHNPYFSRWFSAIKDIVRYVNLAMRHNPYFSRWFSAIELEEINEFEKESHNPYFSRWFSAINYE